MNEKNTNPAPFISSTGNEFVLKLYNAIRSVVRAHHDLSALHEMVADLLRGEERLSIELARDRFLLNDHRIEMRSGHAVNHILLKEFKKRKIGRIEFSGLPGIQDLEEFIGFLTRAPDNGLVTGQMLQRILEEKRIRSVRVEGPRPDIDNEDRSLAHERQTRYTQIYFYAAELMTEIFVRAARKEALDLNLARRVVRSMVSGYAVAPAVFMGLATTKTIRDFLANHSVNVAIYAIALGHRLGLSNRFMVDLGCAALFHDVGETHLAWLPEGRKTDLTEQEWVEAKSHPVIGVKIIMRASEADETTLSRLTGGIFAHHLGYDQSGFPKPRKRRNVPLVSGIVSLADFYDLAVRPYGKNEFPCFSGRVPELIMDRAGKNFDPVLAKYFVRILGILPVGTLCRLDTGELGIVSGLMEEGTTGERPWIRLLVPVEETYRAGDLVFLGAVDEKTGKYRRNVHEILDPNAVRIDVAEYLIGF
jgi:HD-GYP domain-containing protein (c-di-GMP phosphodiesterase class II)